MSKEHFNLSYLRKPLQNKDSFLWTKSQRAQDYFTKQNLTQQNYLTPSNNLVSINQRYVTLEIQFNRHYKDQLKNNQTKFNKHYYRCIEKLGDKNIPLKKQKQVFENVNTKKQFDTTCLSLKFQKLNQRLVKSEHKIFEETFHKASERDQSTQLSVEPLRFRQHNQFCEKLKKISAQKDNCQEIEDTPSSRRTFINELQDLQERREEKE